MAVLRSDEASEAFTYLVMLFRFVPMCRFRISCFSVIF